MRLRFLLLLLPLGLLINELTIVDDLAYRWVRLRSNLNKVNFAFKSNAQSFTTWEYAKRTTLCINNAYLRGTDFVVDFMFSLWFLTRTLRRDVRTPQTDLRVKWMNCTERTQR